MIDRELFSKTIYDEQSQLEEREISAFIGAVTELFGLEEARVAEREWLEEESLIDAPPRSIERDWQSVTVAALARLAGRIPASDSVWLSASSKLQRRM